MVAAARREERLASLCEEITGETGRVALYLLADQARWITGTVLPVDGGAHAR